MVSLEFNKQRDLGALVVIYLFLTAMILILDQGWGMTGICLIILGITGMLLNQNFISLSLQQHGKLVVRLGFAAIPLTLLLFVIFPRLGPLWKVPEANLGRVGLSESMSPGDFSELGRSAALAFRASFDGARPGRAQLYWRTLVFEAFDGREWAIHPATQLLHKQLSPQQSQPQPDSALRYRYEVIAEASGQPWLFALSVPWSAQPDVVTLADQRLARTRVVNQTFQYRAQAYAAPDYRPLATQELRRNLYLQPDGGKQSRAFAAQLMAQAGSVERWAQLLLTHFAEQPFYYTLQPGQYLNEPIDQFMFERRRGFCGHYASAMAFMARSVGIPARVVAGYQGGEWDPQGEYLSIYQFDAHAWVELFLPGSGWTRYDPTAAVAPQRVLDGVEQALGQEDAFLADSPLSLLRFRDSAMLNQLRWMIANMDYYWTVWVLGFDAQRQTAFWRDLFGELEWLGKLVLLMLAVISPALVLLLWRRERFSQSRIWRHYHKLLPHLHKAGWPLHAGITPRQYAQQIKQAEASVGIPFSQLVAQCYQIEYAGMEPAPEVRKRLKAQANKTRRALNRWQRQR